MTDKFIHKLLTYYIAITWLANGAGYLLDVKDGHPVFWLFPGTMERQEFRNGSSYFIHLFVDVFKLHILEDCFYIKETEEPQVLSRQLFQIPTGLINA
jgi:hypothetical protein